MIVHFFKIIHHLAKTNNENLELYISFYLKLRGKAMPLSMDAVFDFLV